MSLWHLCDIYFLLWLQLCLLSILHVFYAAYMFYGTAFMYNHAILCIFSPNLEVEINIIIIIKPSSTGQDILLPKCYK